MHNFAYAHQVLQQPGTVMPEAFLVPLKKSAEWWAMDWMQRHTHLLPRFDDGGRMLSHGHALAAAAGISCLMRRTYRNATEPDAASRYDFLNYFECASDDMPTFHAVVEALRDVSRNPSGRSSARTDVAWQAGLQLADTFERSKAEAKQSSA